VVTCPWCGTSYPSFRSNCKSCGGSLRRPTENATVAATQPATPPLPPRNVPSQVIWRILLTDGWAIAGLVFILLGLIFGVLGTALTLSLVAAFVGLPFAGLGALFLLTAVLLLAWRYHVARRTVKVLERGEATLGEISKVYQNYHVQVNGRYPWTVAYRFAASGRECHGQVTTLSQPDLSQQPGKPVYVLYMRDDPSQNTIYPSPYGYFGL